MLTKDAEPTEQFQEIHLAGCVIRDNAGKILLLHRNTVKLQQWELPGGKIEPNEEPTATAIREIFEELGVKVKVLNEFGRHDFIENGYNMGYIWFNAEIIEGLPRPEEEKHDQIGYFSWEVLRAMDGLSANLKNLVDYYFLR
jgi:8-oxo-dGTP pyrophosphatase MutT (NUDIX family)